MAEAGASGSRDGRLASRAGTSCLHPGNRPRKPGLISIVEKKKTKLLCVAFERNKIESRIDE